jgi:hypothetical protein
VPAYAGIDIGGQGIGNRGTHQRLERICPSGECNYSLGGCVNTRYAHGQGIFNVRGRVCGYADMGLCTGVHRAC